MKIKNVKPAPPSKPTLDEEECWRAVQQRDLLADPQFVYGVRSTGNLLPRFLPLTPAEKRDRIAFFATPELAEHHGFRACQRCRPRESSRHAGLILRICRFIEHNSDEPVSLARLGAEMKLSPLHLQKVFKRLTGISPREYAAACRFADFKRGLKLRHSVTEALFAAGYGSTSRLYEKIAARLGMTPRRYAAGGTGARIRYVLSDCPLGRVLIASTDQGICAISLGQPDAQLVAALRQEFPAAEIQPAANELRVSLKTVCAYLDGAPAKINLPLDIQATAFQWRVWRALQAIPRGETRTYSEIARAIQQPAAIRAVARACATNPAALAVPCHRVIRADGHLGGYRWGLKRKQALLKLEKTKSKL